MRKLFGKVVEANRDVANDWEKWEIAKVDDRYVTIKSSGGMYLSASDNGFVKVSKKVGENEKFELVSFGN